MPSRRGRGRSRSWRSRPAFAAALAKRFVDLVGDTPMQYLAAWRMHLARRLLRESNIGIAELAARVGYEFEAAFSRAFRRASACRRPLARRQCVG